MTPARTSSISPRQIHRHERVTPAPDRATGLQKSTGPQQIHLSHSIHRPPVSHQRCNNLLMPVNRA
ncbi:hypothetical protein NG798_25220 [Ancylothrix sp. C2]|uniref:hypothetical protein n=1 Tax=Ancylothrix sp. D3o TaxID=2953691 RepID=UPI0021BB930F|nr:hypothetical protein [Ancylothrix sp. D3o]MCT7953103.1 hypothetical protein [Ancylothrix sp. D3o]